MAFLTSLPHDGTTQESSLELAVQSAAHFNLSTDQASTIIKEIADVVYGQRWLHANLQDVPDTLRKRLESCFGRQKEITGARRFGYWSTCQAIRRGALFDFESPCCSILEQLCSTPGG